MLKSYYIKDGFFEMFPGINPKQLKQAMKKMGVKQEAIDAEEVVIKTKDKELLIRNPEVSKINMMGQESIQITGDIEERSLEKFDNDDIKTVIEQTNCSEEEARKALEKKGGDLAAAIIDVNNNKT